MSDDVAIVGIGMHPFGRHDGVTGMEQGAVAIRNACADAGVEWGDLQCSRHYRCEGYAVWATHLCLLSKRVRQLLPLMRQC